jgi:Peptidase family C25/Fibronectin type III domain
MRPTQDCHYLSPAILCNVQSLRARNQSVPKALSVFSSLILLAVLSASASAQTSTQNFGAGTGSQTSQTGSTVFIPNPTSGTTWARAGATAPNAPIVLATASNPLATTGAYVRGVAAFNTSVSKFSPMVAYTGGTEFYTSFKVLFGDSAASNTATTGSWNFYQGAGVMYADANDFSGAQVFTGLRFTYGAAGALNLTYRGGAAFITTGLTTTAFNQATVYTIEIVGNNKTSGTINYSYSGNAQTVAVQKFDLYINGTLVGDDLAEAALPANTSINSNTFIGISSTSNVANVFVDDVVVYNAVPASIGTTPTITTSVASLPNFGAVTVGSNSSEQSYTVSATNLTTDITVVAPTDFQVSKTGGGIGFGSSVTLLQAGGLVNAQQVFVRFSPGTAGAKAGNITHDSTGATQKLVAVSGTGTAGLASEPTVQASTIVFSSVTTNSMTLTWTNGNGSNRIVLGKELTAVNSNPVDGTSYTANTTFGGGSQIGTNNFVVFNGITNTVAVTGLTPGTTYNFAVYEFNGTGGSENYLTTAPATGAQATSIATYTWNAVGTASWATAANWTPTRTTPSASDILQFNAGGSVVVTGVPTQTVGQLSLSGNSTVLLEAAATGTTLTIAGGSGTDLSVASGSALNVDTGNTLSMTVATGATGTISGAMMFSGAADSLTAADASGITFNPASTFTQGIGCSGNVFGSAGTPNTIVFASGSTFVQQAGASPFALSQPASKVVFQTGSLFSFQQNSAPSFAGRTYSNLEINFATFSQSSTGAAALSIDDLTVTLGTLNLGMTGTFNLKGNVSVAAGQTLNFNAGSASVISLNGSSVQTISGGGTLTFGANETLAVNNSNGVVLSRNVTLTGLTLTSGVITTGANTLTLASGTVTGGSSASYVSGTLKKTAVPASFTFPVGVTAVAGHAAGYTPLDLANAIGGGDLTVTTNHAVQTVLDTSKSLNEYWTLASAGTLTADLTFHYLDTDVNGTEIDYQVIVVESGNATHFPADIEHSVDTGANTFSVTGVSSFSDWSVGEPAAPTAVRLTSFRAVRNNGEVTLQWQSGYEARNLGYNIYREQDGKRVAITPSLVAGSALLAGRQTRLGAGSSYTWYDNVSAEAGPATYWLEDIDLNGTRTLHGPIVPEISYAKPRGRELRADLMSEVSRRTTPNSVQISGWANRSTRQDKQGNSGDAMFADPSDIQHDIAGMAGVKLAVTRAGWYRVSQTELAAAGFTVQHAGQLQLYRNGREVAISLSNGITFTKSDYLEFYGEGLDSPTSDVQTYYLVNGRGNGARINAANGIANPAQPSGPQSFAYTVERRERMIYFSGLRNGDAENFFGQIVSSDPVTANVPVNNLAGSSAQLEVVLQGVTNENHLVHVVFNGSDLGTINFANTDHPAGKFTVPAAALREGDNSVELTSMAGASDVSLIDVVRLTYNRNLTATDNALSFSVNSRDTRRISGFTNPNVRVLDISDANSPFELKAAVSPDAGGYAVMVESKLASALSTRTLLAIAGSQSRAVDSVRANVPSAWWAQKAGANYVLLTAADLATALEPLAQLRRSQGMTVAVVDVEDVYDEFSFGKHSPEALRDFLQRAMKSWKRQPRFVLFAGDASYDPRNYLGQGLNDLVPTKLIDTSLTETASDDWLADFNQDGIADLAIGRLPIRTAAEASQLVNKIVSYENSAVDTSRSALLVADSSFEATNNAMKNLLPAGQPVQLINRSATDDATAHSQVINGLNQGPRLANYFGHGSNGIWSGAGLLSSNDAPGLTNNTRLSVFTMMTCFNGYFHDAYNESLSEALLKSHGGAVAVWASTGLTEPTGQNVIGGEFYRLLFGSPQLTLGDAARMAKSFTNDADVRRTWTLFGDPASRLR